MQIPLYTWECWGRFRGVRHLRVAIPPLGFTVEAGDTTGLPPSPNNVVRSVLMRE